MIGNLLCLGATVVVLLGDYVLKRAADAGLSLWSWQAVLGYSLYGVSGIGWLLVLRYLTLGQMAVSFAVLTLLANVAMGVALFGERLELREYVGICMAIGAMFLMARLA